MAELALIRLIANAAADRDFFPSASAPLRFLASLPGLREWQAISPGNAVNNLANDGAMLQNGAYDSGR
jgi:hypothetical protein